MLYKIELQQNTATIGNVVANTLFGAFLTAYSTIYTVDKDMIDDIVLSDLFYNNILPKGVINNKTVFSKPFEHTQIEMSRALIARDNESTNVVNNTVGNIDKKCSFFISTKLLDKNDIEEIVKLMCEFGIGKWRNVGKGQFEFKSIEEYVPKTDVKRFVCLSSFIPDCDINDYDISSLGYTIRDAYATNGIKQKQTIMLLTGTSFRTFREVVGKHVYDENSNTYIHGKSIVIGV